MRKRINISVSEDVHARTEKMCRRLGFRTPATLCARLLEVITMHAGEGDTDEGKETGGGIVEEIEGMFDEFTEWDRNSGSAYLGRIYRKL